MKKILNKSIKDEGGQALIMVLILLLLGGLIIPPLLAYMSTGLIVGQEVYDKRMDELYAAEAGVEDALWQIKTVAAGLPKAEDDPPREWSYSIIDDVNGKVVSPIIITYIEEGTYKIESTATSDGGDNTTIEAYINIIDFTNFMDNAITSMNDVELGSNTTVDGDIQYNGELKESPGSTITGDTTDDPIEGWPTAEQLHDYYWPDVAGLGEFPDATIDLKDPPSIPSLYRVGDLTITNTGESGVAGWLEEDGIVYVTGDLEFKQTGNKDYEIHLNYATIFVLGNIDFPSDRCTVYGPGCIIAVGDINFQPKMAAIDEPDVKDFIFVMSVEGTVNFQPNGDFYGSLAGNVNVNLQPGCSLIWNGPPPELKFPGSEPSTTNVIQAIRTWEISLYKD